MFTLDNCHVILVSQLFPFSVFIHSDQAAPARGRLSTGLSHLSSWDTEHLHSSTPHPPGSASSHHHHHHRPSPPLLPSPLQVDQNTIAHYSQSYASAGGHQHQPRHQHLPSVITSATERGKTEQHCPAECHWQPHGKHQRWVSPPAALQLLNLPPAVHTVHVLDGRAEELLEQNSQG